MSVKKIRIFLVDDEPIAIRHFRNMLDTNSEYYEFAGSASNGARALLQIRAEKPDLVISDIQMPGMNGLELAERLKKENPLIKVVLLTAYKDFSYAQKGVNAGIHAYLVKSEVTKDQLETIIRNVYEEILSETEQKRAYLEKNMKHFLESDGDNLKKNLGYEGNNFLLLDIVARQPVCLVGFCEELIEFPVTRMEKELKTEDIFCKVALRMTKNTCLILLFLKKGLYEQAYHYQMNRIYNMIRSFLAEEGCDAAVITSKLLYYYDDIPSAYRQLKKCEPYIFIDKPFQRLHMDQVIKSEENYYLLTQLREKLFQSGQTVKGRENLQLIFQTGHEGCSAAQYLNELNVLSMQIIGWGERLYLAETQKWREERQQIFHDIGKAEDWIAGIYGVCLDAQEKKTRVLYSETVLKFMDLVEREYAGSLTSEDICACLNISKSHFRRIFKQEVGLTPMDYLNKYRIEMAKKLLRQGDRRIQDIYEQVGFTSCQYFSTVFKKYTGISPWQYQQKKGWSLSEKDNPV